MKTLFAALAGIVLVLSTFTAHSATYYFHNDHLGTPQVVTDESQAVVWQGDYDPFGEATETVAAVEQNLRFPGQYLDRESGLHYNYFRTYDPSIGRYTQSDPIGLGGGVSTYGYAYQNALRYTDPTGEVVPVAVWWAATSLFTAFQAAGLVYDAYGTAATFADECSTTTEKVVGGIGLVVSVGLPIKGVSSFLKNVPNNAGTETVQRWMSKAELEATQKTGLLRGGRDGTHYVTDAANSNAKRARQRSALPQTPEVKVTLEVPKGKFSQPTRVEPAFNMPGGGMERTATGDIPVTIKRIQ